MRRLITTLTLLALAAPAAAQSFDCTQAATPTEHAICDSRTLSNLDVEMAMLWGVVGELPLMMGARGEQNDAAHLFLTNRDACGDERACLEKAYRERNAALKQTISDAMKDYCKAIELC